MILCARNPGRGLRRFDEASATADRYCDEFKGLTEGITPGKALLALKQAAPYLKVPLRTIALVDLLFSWTKPQDWTTGSTPIVWPSNELLASKLGVGIRQLQNLLNQAQRLGLISFRDSPNGHRGGLRHADGRLRWAYGIALAPIGARYNEFTAVAQEGTARDKAIAALRRRLSACRRKIRSIAQAATDAALDPSIADEADTLIELTCLKMRNVRDVTQLDARVRELEHKQRTLAQVFATAVASVKAEKHDTESASEHAKNFMHSTTTMQEQSAKAEYSKGTAEMCRRVEVIASSKSLSRVEADLDKYGITPEFLNDIAPELCGELHHGKRSWGHVVAIAERLSAQHSITPTAWNEACKAMGNRGAASSVISTIRKYQLGEVQRPGAYLRGMTSKAQRGELNLGRSLYGLKEANRSIPHGAIPSPSENSSIGAILYSRLAGLSSMRALT